jgi:triosephosphate isomerase
VIYAANWKLNKSPVDAKRFVKELLALSPIPEKDVILFPQALAGAALSEALQGTKVSWGLQNSFSSASGAFTGENSLQVAKDMGAQYVLVGHSERRSLFKETNEALALKIQHAQNLGITPIYCIGETLEERQKNQTRSVLIEQVHRGLHLAVKDLPLIIAYEPVWAIGTGQVATREQVLETHAWIQEILLDYGFPALPLLYGGSVKPENAAELKKIKHVDGFLIGGAGLEASSLVGIIAAQ